MLDNLYENIGGKIKNWAKWTFIVEAIVAVITGLILLFTDENFILYGLLTLICGPFVAWVGSWILYAFGELVEKACANENNTRQILEKLNVETTESENNRMYKASIVKSQANGQPKEKKEKREDTTSLPTTENRDIKFSQPIISKENSAAPYWCGKCGHDGPYDGNCPNCNSSLKKYNVNHKA